jgi:ABC-type polar amino acid transport system ATPase subunit
VQDIGISFHQKAHLPAGTSGVQQQRVTRIALRLGLGSRSLAH